MAQKEQRKGKGGLKEAPKEFQEELLSVDRVTRVTAGGRQLRFRASVVIGNGKGKVGLGIGKAGEVVVAIEKATRDAKKHMVEFPIVGGTIPFDVERKYKASRIFLHPASPGTGIIAGGAVRKLFMVSGIRDILTKQHGAPNNITNVRVVLDALTDLAAKPKAQELAEADRARVRQEREEQKTSDQTEKKSVVKDAPARMSRTKKFVQKEETPEMPDTSTEARESAENTQENPEISTDSGTAENSKILTQSAPEASAETTETNETPAASDADTPPVSDSKAPETSDSSTVDEPAKTTSGESADTAESTPDSTDEPVKSAS